VKVFLERFSNNTISVYENTELFKHSIDIGLTFSFSTFTHNNEDWTASLNILFDFFKFLASEGHLGATNKYKISRRHLLVIELFLIDFALIAGFKLLDDLFVALVRIQHLFFTRVE